jgi:hypothetical protein
VTKRGRCPRPPARTLLKRMLDEAAYDRNKAVWMHPTFPLAWRWLWCGFGVALVWLWWRFRVALEWLWSPNRLAISRLWCGFMMALGCLCTPEYMPSICLLYGFAVALGGLQPFLVQGSRFDVRGSTFSLRSEPQTQESRLPPICRKPGPYYEARRRLAALPGVRK